MGGGGTLAALEVFRDCGLGCFGAAGTSDGRGAEACGASRCARTSNFSPSLMERKLGETLRHREEKLISRIVHAEASAIQELRVQAADLASRAAEKLLRDELAKSGGKLVDAAIKDLPGQLGGGSGAAGRRRRADGPGQGDPGHPGGGRGGERRRHGPGPCASTRRRSRSAVSHRSRCRRSRRRHHCRRGGRAAWSWWSGGGSSGPWDRWS